MIDRPVRIVAATAIALTCSTMFVTAAQIRRQTPGSNQVAVEISLKGAEGYEAQGQGSCTHAPKASIYGVVAELWSVRHEADGRSMQLTLWKPADGSATMFSLSLRTTTISTVKGGQVMGSGTVTLAPAGKGGTFTVDAKTRTGQAVTGTIKCDAFTPHIAEGGN